MRKPVLIAIVVLIAAVIIVGGICSLLLPTRIDSESSADSSFAQSEPAAAQPTPAAIPASAQFAEEPEMAFVDDAMVKAAASDSSTGSSPPSLDNGRQKIISTASLAVEVEDVSPAVDRVRDITKELGGFVEHLSSFGGDNQENANLTVRVPQDQFTAAVDRISGLGNVQNRELGREDVSEQFVDLEARLKSLQREETSLLSLLELATSVADVLAIERELSRIRSEIERHQGRLDFLSRRVDLATIQVNLFPPRDRFPQPPSAHLTVEVKQVSDRVDEVKSLVGSHDGGLDRVFRSTRNEKDRAEISFRVFPQDFADVMQVLEDQGKVLNKEVVEATGGGDDALKTPNARINVAFQEPDPREAGLLLFLGLPIAAIILVSGLAAAFYWTYQRGRRRRDRFLG